ncbi:hypothetical protein GBA63_02620 [Rubrobacter tropicus]|uniref:Cyclodeaminase/cyclohydrolase domain-containing protein n=1 Tax=Rubrobacter tropicus TaxID=2653851 RepID=A0A6G8Q576_9ACTN|nr:hypothetical protein [Rubrobacter tropicus]QIN81644.1 hypothetical protein GBA63_02620 [Rubrobacter tropicus]
MMAPGCVSVASAGVVAADLLVEACRSGPEDDLRLETVRGLATDLGRRLASLAETADGTSDSTIEAALACADLATLAVCNVPGLPKGGRALGAAATHLAAGVTHALLELVENAGAVDPHAENVSRDARSAGWKADLAVRQLGELG